MDFKIGETTNDQSQQMEFARTVEELSDLQLMLVGGGSGDVIFA